MLVFRGALSFVLTLLVTSTLVQAAKPAPKPQEVFAPYWTAEAGWETELQLKNNLSAGPLTITPVLRLASGQEIALDPVTIASNTSVSVWVNEALSKHSAGVLSQPGSYGSVAFRFTSFYPRNLYAAVALSLHGGPIGFQIDANPTASSEPWPGAALAGSREGIWWQPRPVENDLLILSNSSEKALAGTLWLSDAAGKRSGQRLSLAGHQTRRLSVGDLVRAAKLSGRYGGIEFEVAANVGALDSVHLMYDEAAKYSASLKMFSRDPGATLQERTWAGNKEWTTWAPMLALRSPDPAAGLPARTVLQPAIFVRNTTGKKLPASITLSWRGDSGKGQVKLPELQLAPFATQLLQIGAMQKQLGIPDDAHWALVTLTSPASPDDLIAMASSPDKTGRYNLETRFSDNLGGHFAGGEWRADTTHNLLAAVTNGGNRATDALLTLHYDEGKKKYEMQQTIQPGEQMWVNFADLIHNRVPDRKGNVLPADLSYGTYDLHDLGSGPGSLLPGNLALDTTWGHHGAPPPGPTCCAIDVVFQPSETDLYIGQYDALGAQGTDQCTGDKSQVSAEIQLWWPTDASIAQVTKQQMEGVGPGSTFGNGKGLFWEGQGSNCVLMWVYPQVEINVPALSCTASVTRGGTATCTITPSEVTVTAWQFKDGGGNIVKRAQDVGSLTWSGVMVTGGTVSATVSGLSSPLTWSIAVSNRTNFAFTAVSPAPEGDPFTGDGCSVNVASPPQQSGDAVGIFCLAQYFSFNTTTVNDNGPNNGYSYVTLISSSSGGSTTGYFYVISPDLENTSSAFYLAQCGNYNPTAQTGFISGSNLLAYTKRHEAGNSTEPL